MANSKQLPRGTSIGFAIYNLLLCSALILFLLTFNFSPDTGASLIILNVSALLGTVSKGFLVVRGTNSFSSSQGVTRSQPPTSAGERPSEEPLGRQREAERVGQQQLRMAALGEEMSSKPS